jgi:hypothetical protein
VHVLTLTASEDFTSTRSPTHPYCLREYGLALLGCGSGAKVKVDMAKPLFEIKRGRCTLSVQQGSADCAALLRFF